MNNCNCDEDYFCESPECIEKLEQLEKEMKREYRLYCIKLEDGTLFDTRELRTR